MGDIIPPIVSPISLLLLTPRLIIEFFTMITGKKQTPIVSTVNVIIPNANSFFEGDLNNLLKFFILK
jgi:hypothetical protein